MKHHLSLILVGTLLSACSTIPSTPDAPAAAAEKMPSEVVDFAKVTQRPTPIKYQTPVYPKEAANTRRSGTVVVRFILDEQGIPRNPVCVESSDPIFEAAALAAIKGWRFTPARLDGRTVATWLQVPISFEPR